MTSHTISGQTAVGTRFVSMDEIAEMLSVSARSIRRLTVDGEIPHIRVGGQYRYEPDKVLETLREGTETQQ